MELRKLANGLGLSLSTSKHKRNGRRQLLVHEIMHGSPAALSNVIRVDDVLTAIDRRVLGPNQQNMPAVASILGQYPVGSMILFTFFRYPGGSKRTWGGMRQVACHERRRLTPAGTLPHHRPQARRRDRRGGGVCGTHGGGGV